MCDDVGVVDDECGDHKVVVDDDWFDVVCDVTVMMFV